MADITLGQSINGSFTSSDPKNVSTSPTNPLGIDTFGKFYDDYDLKGVDDFRQLKISVEGTGVNRNSPTTVLQLVNATTGAIVAGSQSVNGILTLERTTFTGGNYKIRVADSTLGDYKISVVDGGKATSIVSASRRVDTVVTGTTVVSDGVGTVGESGAYFPLANLTLGQLPLSDLALSSGGQFYGLATFANSNAIGKIDPNLDRTKQIEVADSTKLIKDTQGNKLEGNLSALEFGADQKLYALGTVATGGKLFQIDVNTNVATSIADLPAGLNGSGDLVYNAANNSFFAVAEDTATSDALWAIPLANPSGATKIGQLGITGVGGIDFENGQLTGFTGKGSSALFAFNDNITGDRIKIDASTGIGTIDKIISTENLEPPLNNKSVGISGASTIIAQSAPVIPATPVVTPTTPTTPGVVNPNTPVLPITVLTNTPTTPAAPTFPTSAVDAIGTKGQTLTNRTLNLADYKGQALKVDTVSEGDAAYTNNVGFYAVQDEIGTIKLANGGTVKPGDANYAVEAIKSAILQAGKIDSKLGRDIVGGELYAPVVVAQGSFSDFVSKNPTNGGGGNAIHAYFTYIGANTDKFDHFKLIAPNTFAVEDQFGGGDKDFNDLIVNMNVKIA